MNSVQTDEQLLSSIQQISGLKTSQEIIHLALQKLLQFYTQKSLLELEGKINWEGDLEELRTERFSNDFS
jgi:Arc/MetJ family transcription regulator